MDGHWADSRANRRQEAALLPLSVTCWQILIRYWRNSASSSGFEPAGAERDFSSLSSDSRIVAKEASLKKIDFENFQTASLRSLRSTNSAIVLNFVRYHQPISRAEIAERTGLQKSTVSLIVEELIGQGVLLERRSVTSQPGGVPRLLSINVEIGYSVGIDIEVSETTVALADLMGNVIDCHVIRTPSDPSSFVQALAASVNKLRAAISKDSFLGVGVAVSGLVDHDAGTILLASNLGWTDFPLGPKLRRRVKSAVFVDNESNLSALAEIWKGDFANRSCPDLVFINVKEGIGAGIVIGGRVHRGFSSIGAEFGHMVIQVDGPRCGCGNNGCWEMLADDRATVREYLSQCRSRGGARNRKSNGVTIHDVVGLALAGDPEARGALTKTARFLGTGIQNIVLGLSPEVVVVAGAITGAWELIAEDLQLQMRQGILGRSFEHTRLVTCSLSAKPSLVGAMLLGSAAYFGLPSNV